jgi:hypothetical protein
LLSSFGLQPINKMKIKIREELVVLVGILFVDFLF